MGFHGEALLAPRPSPKLDDHPLSAVRDCLFNLFAATIHIGGPSSIRNLRKRHAVVTGTHLSHGSCSLHDQKIVSVDKENFLLHSLQTGTGARPVCYKTGEEKSHNK